MNMRALTTAFRPLTVLFAALAMAGVALAQDQPPPDEQGGNDQDPPARVARLSLTQGSVSLEPAGAQEWANADVNRPLTTGDKLWTDQNSRAELDIGSAAIRLGDTTGFSFINLDDKTAQMQVTAGTLIVRVRSLGEGETFEVDTPNLAVSLMQPGQYRVEVNEAGDTTVVSVAEGEAQAIGNGQGFPIHAQQRGQFTGTDRLSSVLGTLGAPDQLDEWSLSRDRQTASAQSQQYVSPEATGYADLDTNGNWESTPDYGYVWYPTTVVADWAPYRFGHWVWIAPWGWTWIDNAPWGFAPFHYGRWAYYRSRWCWVPGPRRIRPVYAPALVGWVGRPGAGVTISVGAGVSWFPLGPREVYVPSYRVSPRYVERVNITNTTIVNRTYITNVYENRVTNVTYVNRNVRGGVTTVSESVFTGAQPVGRNRMRIPEQELRGLRASAAAPAIVPVRQSLVGASARINVRQPPARIIERPVIARTPPPRPAVSFDRQSEAIRANGGRPLGRGDLARMQPNVSTSAPQVRVVSPPRENGFGSSIGDRERAIRDNRTFPPANNGGQPNGGSNESPQARRGMRLDRPPAAQPPQQTRPQERGQPQGEPRQQAQPQQQAQQPQERYQPPPQRSYSTGGQNEEGRADGNERSFPGRRGFPERNPDRPSDRPAMPVAPPPRVTPPPPTPEPRVEQRAVPQAPPVREPPVQRSIPQPQPSPPMRSVPPPPAVPQTRSVPPPQPQQRSEPRNEQRRAEPPQRGRQPDNQRNQN
jgi:FecR protein